MPLVGTPPFRAAPKTRIAIADLTCFTCSGGGAHRAPRAHDHGDGAGDDPQRPPLALRLDYKRNIEGKAIAEASVKEMRRFVADEALLKRWGEAMARLFPDVKPGDHILGVYRPEGAVFLFNGQALGEIAEPAFARQFFAIWLDPRTSAPELREALLRRAG